MKFLVCHGHPPSSGHRINADNDLHTIHIHADIVRSGVQTISCDAINIVSPRLVVVTALHTYHTIAPA